MLPPTPIKVAGFPRCCPSVRFASTLIYADFYADSRR